MTDEERTKLRRASAGALLLASRRTERLMTAASTVVIASAAHELLQHRRSDRRPKAGALLVLLAAAKQMTTGFTSAISAGRKQARSLAAQRLGEELRIAGIGSEMGSPGLHAASHMARMAADELEANVAAESLAGQWRSMAAREVLKAQREIWQGGPYREMGEVPARDVAQAVSSTAKDLGPRIARTATTESARAYNDEHEERLRDLVLSGDLDPGEVLREWSALIDACERCWPHDGEQVRIDESFVGGDVPGSVHPRCACSEILVSAV